MKKVFKALRAILPEAPVTSSFEFVDMNRENTFEVYRDGVALGMVWKAGTTWHADPYSLSNPSIAEPTREEAAAKL